MATGEIKKRRLSHTAAFKLKIVREALARPAGHRIKPTCHDYPEIEPVSRSAAELICGSLRPGFSLTCRAHLTCEGAAS